ncbi:MAG: asparaginase [Bdellovibrionota bacterium]
MQLTAPWSVEVYRGKNVESIHSVAVSVVDVQGKSVKEIGDVNALAYPRSAIKFLQAIPFVETGALESCSLTAKHLALACASHQAEAFHMEILTQWISELGLQDQDLACGPQIPSHTRLMNNCSGKHLGMLTTAKHLGESFAEYHLVDHPVQKRITKILSEFTKFDFSKTTFGIDGCGIPTFALPLSSWAVAMSTLLDPKGSEDRKNACRRILAAVTQYPELVSGSEHLDLKIQQITGGKLIIKSGAEGFCNGLLPDQGFAFAIKVLDGNARAIAASIYGILHECGGFSAEMLHQLEPLLMTEIKNTQNKIVGKISLRKNH